MPTDNGELRDALIKVYAMEKGTCEFYERAARAAYEEAARAGFKELARLEGEHMDYIRYLYHAMAGGRELMDIEKFRRNRPEVPEEEVPEAGPGEWASDYSFVDELGAIMEALKMEARLFAFYDDIIGKVRGTEAGALIERLKNLEETHIKYLKELRLRLDETA